VAKGLRLLDKLDDAEPSTLRDGRRKAKNPPRRVSLNSCCKGFSGGFDPIRPLSTAGYSATTFAAAGPFWPCSMVNSTCWPSLRVLKLVDWIAEKCTNTSLLPSAGEMKPKPLSALKNFTVPVVLLDKIISLGT